MGARNSHGKFENNKQEKSIQKININIYNKYNHTKSKFQVDESYQKIIDFFVLNKDLKKGHYLTRIKKFLEELRTDPSKLVCHNYNFDTTNIAIGSNIYIMDEYNYYKFQQAIFVKKQNNYFFVNIGGIVKKIKWLYIYNDNTILHILHKLIDNMILITKNYIIKNNNNIINSYNYNSKLKSITNHFELFGTIPTYNKISYNDIINHLQTDLKTIRKNTTTKMDMHHYRHINWKISCGEKEMANMYNVFLTNTLTPFEIEVNNTLDKYNTLLINLNTIKENINFIKTDIIDRNLTSNQHISIKLKEFCIQISTTIKEIKGNYPGFVSID